MANLVRRAPRVERDLCARASESDTRRGRIWLREDALHEVTRSVERNRELRAPAPQGIENRAAELFVQRPKEIDFTLFAKYRILYLHTL